MGTPTRESLERVEELMGPNGSREQAARMLRKYSILEIDGMTDEAFFYAWSACERAASDAEHEESEVIEGE